jgi:hypothetical protein
MVFSLDKEIEIPAKLFDVQYYVRLKDGIPQIACIEPMFNDSGLLIQDTVYFYFDDSVPIMMPRSTAEMMCEPFTPLSKLAQYKHRMLN